MGRNRKRKYPNSQIKQTNVNPIPIPNLPEKYLNIRLRSKRVKMKNLLTLAFDKCKTEDAVLWSAAGKDIEKLISFVEIFKRKQTDFKNQINKLRFTTIDVHENEDLELKNVPEIFIFLSKESSDTSQKEKALEQRNMEKVSKNLTNDTLESFASLNLKSGQKRSIADNPLKSKKHKKKRKANTD